MGKPSPGLWKPAFTVAVLTFLAYVPALGNGFVWDDQGLVVSCFGIRGLSGRHLRWMLTTVHMGNYQPLGLLSLAMDYRLWGLRPFGFHLTNVLLHCANAAVFFLTARRLLERAQPGLNALSASGAAAAAALLFALHPARVESVAWVSERRDVLSGFFFLLCVYFHLAAVDEDADARSRRRGRLLSIACCAASLLSKAIGVSLPLVLLILDFHPLGRFAREGWARLLKEKAPYFVLAAAAALAVLWAQISGRNLTALGDHGLGGRLAQAVLGLGFYLEKTVLPTGLSPLYPLAETLTAPAVLRGAAVLGAAGLGLRLAGLSPALMVALWAYYAVTLFPVLGLVQNGPQAVAVRYSYLSCLGWAALGGVAALRLSRGRPAAAAVLGGALVIASVGLTWASCRKWRDELTLWEGAALALPRSAELKGRHAWALVEAGRPEEGEILFQEALRLDPEHADTRVLLARHLAAVGRLAEAEEEFKRVLGRRPLSVELRSDLGAVIAGQGRLAEAIAILQSAVGLDPSDAGAARNLRQARAELATVGPSAHDSHFKHKKNTHKSDTQPILNKSRGISNEE